MIEGMKTGDLLVVSGKGFGANLIQLGSLSLPNIGPLGRWGIAGASHVAIVANAYPEGSSNGSLLAYESTSFSRPACVRTGRGDPKGMQAHYVRDIIEAGGDVWHFPLRRPLYLDEEDRLLAVLESYLGRGYDFIGAGKSGGGLVMRAVQRLIDGEDLSQLFCSEVAISAFISVGIMTHRNAGAWSPVRTVRYVLRRGICDRGPLLS